MEVNSLRDRLSSGAFSSWTSHTYTDAHAYIRPRIWVQITLFTPILHLSLRVQLRAFSWHSKIPWRCAGADGYCSQWNDVFMDSHWTLLLVAHSKTHRTTSSPAQGMKERKRGREWERGSKLVSGMDSLKWIVLGDIALTFVQSAVLRDLPVCFNSSELARFSLAAERI